VCDVKKNETKKEIERRSTSVSEVAGLFTSMHEV